MCLIVFFSPQVRKCGVVEDRHAGEERCSSIFLLSFPGMKLCKLGMARLRRLKRRWRLHPAQVTYAYPKRVDVHWKGEDRYEDEREDDGDLDEPVMY